MLKDSLMEADAAAAPSSSLRRWEAIAAALRDDITAGRFQPGQCLPNETALAARFGVNRHTLRQAVRSLADSGFVRVVQGRGTFVRELVLDYALQRRTRLTQNLADCGEQASRELRSAQQQPAGGWAAALRLTARQKVEVLQTRATVRGRVIGLSTCAFPLPRFAGMAAAFAETGSVTESLRRFGVSDYTRARSIVSCRMPSAVEADALARPATAPVLVVDYLNVDAEGRPVEAGMTLFASDAVQLSVVPDDFAGE
ncbi:phosphonate metabolism transcriptional regulator PhnF [Caldimonas brevitalea]|uniref:GntR family transcriptional regulator, phosphonate transport system regulatory protein n=1 Tax=Caldimonas brevitalea TaxID=413882 RepID=A0A0G3BLX0_9BURK|nr:phosphonate metabolism transcriptional regulator PhnF [Caldimonas brevitalea]AKJ30392.1 GntR family transcriptional regulator, phosphonate transport system regulatory protein [Caldimonas brevitalea]